MHISRRSHPQPSVIDLLPICARTRLSVCRCLHLAMNELSPVSPTRLSVCRCLHLAGNELSPVCPLLLACPSICQCLHISGTDLSLVLPSFNVYMHSGLTCHLSFYLPMFTLVWTYYQYLMFTPILSDGLPVWAGVLEVWTDVYTELGLCLHPARPVFTTSILSFTSELRSECCFSEFTQRCYKLALSLSVRL